MAVQQARLHGLFHKRFLHLISLMYPLCYHNMFVDACFKKGQSKLLAAAPIGMCQCPTSPGPTSPHCTILAVP
eukprot:4329419-Amphidinium_carterae.2